MKTGTSMSGIVNARNVKKVKCNCSLCYHSEKIYSKTLGIKKRYCKYYQLVEPNKKTCARYYKKK